VYKEQLACKAQPVSKAYRELQEYKASQASKVKLVYKALPE
jgi:hypothetical protein